jgi:hypothetical protein
MNRYFVKRTEGDFSETQKIKASAGHALLAKQAYVVCANKFEVADGRSFFKGLRAFLRELSAAGYTQQVGTWRVTGGKFIPFEKLTHQQIFATWASVQQAIAKWIWNLLPANTYLHCQLLEQDLVFKANDVLAIMELVFELLYQYKGQYGFDPELGMYNLEGRVLKCLSQ